MDLQARNSNVYYHEYLTYIPGTIKEGDRDEPTVHWRIFLANRKNRRPAKNAHRRIVFSKIFWRIELFTRSYTTIASIAILNFLGYLQSEAMGLFVSLKAFVSFKSRLW